jgi:hypothetical protein
VIGVLPSGDKISSLKPLGDRVLIKVGDAVAWQVAGASVVVSGRSSLCCAAMHMPSDSSCHEGQCSSCICRCLVYSACQVQLLHNLQGSSRATLCMHWLATGP